MLAYLPSLTHWACDTRISTKSHAHTHQAQNLTHSANYYKISRFEQQNRTCASICTARSVLHYISLQSRLTWLPGHTAHAHTKQAAALGSAAQRMQVAKLVNCVLCTRVELVRGAPWLKTIHVIRCTALVTHATCRPLPKGASRATARSTFRVFSMERSQDR